MTISILLADDHTILRQGLRALLSSEPDFNIVGETGDGLEAVQLAERLKPDVIIIDLGMPGLSGLEAIRQIHECQPVICIVVLSMHEKEAYALKALRNGARAYVLKGSEADELILAIRKVRTGERYLSPPINQRVIDTLLREIKTDNLDPYEILTSRERQVLPLAAEGLNNSAIGERLGISPRTAEGYRQSIMKKLGLKSQAELIRFALKRELISLDD